MAANTSEHVSEKISQHDVDEKSLSVNEPPSPQDGNDAIERSVTTESAKYPPMSKIILIMLALYISMFLVALVSHLRSITPIQTFRY